MKKIVKGLGIICTAILLFIGCNSTDENGNVMAPTPPPPDGDTDTNTLTLDELATDSTFVHLLEGLVTVHHNSADLPSIQALLEKEHTELTDAELLQIVNAVGFDDVEGYRAYEEAFWLSWASIVERFELPIKDRDSVIQIFADGLIQQKIRSGSPSRVATAHDSGKRLAQCPPGNTQCICGVNLANCLGRLTHYWESLEYCERSGKGFDCYPLENMLFPAGLTLIDTAFCLENYDCCLIGYDSEACAALFPCC